MEPTLPAAEHPKKPYTSPHLIRHGTVEELTGGGPIVPSVTDAISGINTAPSR
jgi:hypothetical protein